jgi:hypothetical protein
MTIRGTPEIDREHPPLSFARALSFSLPGGTELPPTMHRMTSGRAREATAASRVEDVSPTISD